MALKGKKPEPVQHRLKMLLYGAAGTWKTSTAMQFPRAYYIDAEHGTDREQYVAALNAVGSLRLQTNDINEVIEEVRTLATTQHDFRTLVIDPITTLEADIIMRSEDAIISSLEKKGLDEEEASLEAKGDMRVWRDRDRVLKRLGVYLQRLDMNVVIVAHGKQNYGEKMAKLGTTYDAWKRWDYYFDLVLETERRGNRTVAVVRKTRIETFPYGETFDLSYEAIAERYGKGIVEKQAEPMVLATPDRVQKLEGLISMVALKKGTVERWLTKAGVDDFADMPASAVEGCISYIEKLIAKGVADND